MEQVLWDKYGITLSDMAASGCVPPPPQLLSLRMTESEYVKHVSNVCVCERERERERERESVCVCVFVCVCVCAAAAAAATLPWYD